LSIDGLVWLVGDDTSAPDADRVDQGLDAFNRALPALALVRPLCCSGRLTSGQCVGGALARTWGAACELQQLWVDEPWRGRGLGSELVRLVEAEARARGCVSVYLDTFSFQAPGFFRRLGYVTALTIEGFPEGITKFLMTKRLA
jgi:ribosomal protein S18 acetylase RimI-like enzyme